MENRIAISKLEQAIRAIHAQQAEQPDRSLQNSLLHVKAETLELIASDLASSN